MELFHMARTETDDRPYIIGLAAKCVQQETHKTKLNSVALVRERTILTERPPLVGEVSASFCR